MGSFCGLMVVFGIFVFSLLQISDKGFFQAVGVLAFAQLLRRAHIQHPPLMHQRNAVATRRFVHKMGRHKQGDFVAPRQSEQVLPKHIARGWIHAGSGLVQNQHFRAVQTGGGQLQALADAQRQSRRFGIGHFGQLKLLQGIVYRSAGLIGGHLIELGVQIQIAAHAELFVERKRLRHIAHAHPRGHVVGIGGMAKQAGAAFAWLQQAGEHFHGGGFAAAVGAEKAENLAFFNHKAHIVYGGEVAEALG